MIYIVEDDKNIQEIEMFALKNAGYEVKGFEMAKDFYQALDTQVPELILLDIMLPDEDGLKVLQKLRLNKSTVLIPVIMVTAKTTELDKVKGLDMGADDYLTKPFGVMELISRVKALLCRSASIQKKEVYEFEDIRLDDSRHEVQTSKGICELTYKEYELLKYLIINEGLVLTRDRLMEEIWGTDFAGESRTLDMHIKTLRQKLGDSGKLIQTVRNVGYSLNHIRN
ncbi:MAG: response regulator transcription factor [Eubacterium sp.]